MSTLPPVSIYTPGSQPDLFQHPALFLSASVPYERPGLTDPKAIARNRHYLASAKPALIREAVAHLCRFSFQRGLNLIFGAHPLISPMVLDAARRFGSSAGRKQVVIFQSAFFETDLIPRETLELANSGCGELLWTQKQAAKGKPDRDESLKHMRKVMVQSAHLVGSIFIGGMEGVEEESRLFAQHQRGKPCYAIGSTGSAAKDLLSRSPADFRGNNQSIHASELMTLESYPLVMKHLFADLGIP